MPNVRRGIPIAGILAGKLDEGRGIGFAGQETAIELVVNVARRTGYLRRGDLHWHCGNSDSDKQ